MDDYTGDAITRFAMKLMSYTFVHTGKEIEAPWTEFHLDDARWTIPPERIKMGVYRYHSSIDFLSLFWCDALRKLRRL
jgi:hypothetical protein